MSSYGFVKRMFYGVAAKSTPEEDRLFDCALALCKLEDDLKKQMTLPEGKSALFTAHKTTEAWSFELLLWDKLEARGWHTYPGKTKNGALTQLLHTLCIQAECNNGRLNFDMILAEAKKGQCIGNGGRRDPARKDAINFLIAHVSDLEAVVAELKAFTPGDLGARHKCLLVSQDDDQRPGLYDQLKSDFGLFANMRRVPDHLKVLPVTETAPPKPPAGLSL